MNRTSLKPGTRRISHGSEVSKVAAIIGSTAFLAPLIVTSPCNGTPPFINKLSIEIQRITPSMPLGTLGPGEQSKFSVCDCSHQESPRQSTFAIQTTFESVHLGHRQIPPSVFRGTPGNGLLARPIFDKIPFPRLHHREPRGGQNPSLPVARSQSHYWGYMVDC